MSTQDTFYLSSLNFRSSRSEVFLGKGVLKICDKIAREHACQSVISINECPPVNLLYIFKTHFPKKTSGRFLLKRFFKYFSKLSQHSKQLLLLIKPPILLKRLLIVIQTLHNVYSTLSPLAITFVWCISQMFISISSISMNIICYFRFCNVQVFMECRLSL